MSDHCGSITEDGSAVCIPGQCSCSSEQNDEQLIHLSLPKANTFLIKQFFLSMKKKIPLSEKEKNYVEENS